MIRILECFLSSCNHSSGKQNNRVIVHEFILENLRPSEALLGLYLSSADSRGYESMHVSSFLASTCSLLVWFLFSLKSLFNSVHLD